MTHAEMDELYHLYTLGALEPELAAAIEEHLASKCPYCAEHVSAAYRFTAALAGIAEPATPPPALRQRLMCRIAVPSQRPKNWMVAVAALVAACIALLVLFAGARNEIGRLRRQIAALTHERDQFRAALAVMSESKTQTVAFGTAQHGPHGRIFLSPNGGLVFVGSQLPHLPGDRTFELWLVPPTGAPKPAGLFRPNALGESVTVSPVSVRPSQTKAIAVSIEPSGGSSAPTTTPILVVPVG
jgi:anti-sigma-K factor RskA